MNELWFCLHVMISLTFLTLCLRLGKECLIAFLSLSAVLANLFVLKQMNFFGLTITCSDVYAVGAILTLNIVQEYYGKTEAKKASKIGFLCMVFFAIMTKMHLGYAPSPVDQTQNAFLAILGATPRIVAASIATFFLVQRMDIVLFSALRSRFEGKYFPFRATLSLLCSQTFDTVCFTFLGLYGLIENPMHVIAFSLFIKIVVISLSAPVTLVSHRFLEGKEHV